MKYIPGDFITIPNKHIIIGQEPSVQTLYLSICMRADDKGICFPSLSNLQETTGLSKNTVLKATKKLEELGIIQKKSGDRESSNTYQILIKEKGGSSTIEPRSSKENQGVVQNRATNYNHTNNNIQEEEKREIHPYLGFPLPEEWNDETFFDGSVETPTVVFTDEFGRKIPQREITARKKQFQANQKRFNTISKTHTAWSKQAVKLLQEVQGIYKLDGGDNYKHAEEVKKQFIVHLEKDFGKTDVPEEELLKNFKRFLEMTKEHPFHGKNATSMGYINRNFNKIVRDIN